MAPVWHIMNHRGECHVSDAHVSGARRRHGGRRRRMSMKRPMVIGVRFLWRATEDDAESAVRAIARCVDSSTSIAPVWRFAPYWFAWFADLPIVPIVATPLIDHLGRRSEVFLTAGDAAGFHALLAMAETLSHPPVALDRVTAHSRNVTLWLDPYESACGDYLDVAAIDAAQTWIRALRAHWHGPMGVIRRPPGESAWRIARLRRFDAFAAQMQLVAMHFPEIAVAPGMTPHAVMQRVYQMQRGGDAIPPPQPSTNLTVAVPSPTTAWMRRPAMHVAAIARRRLADECDRALARLPSSYHARFEEEQQQARRAGLADMLWTVAALGRLLHAASGVAWVRAPWNASLTVFALGHSLIDPVRADAALDLRSVGAAAHVLVPWDYERAVTPMLRRDGWTIVGMPHRPMPVRADHVARLPHAGMVLPETEPIPIHCNGVALMPSHARAVSFRVTPSNVLMGLRSAWSALPRLSAIGADAHAAIPYDLVLHPHAAALFPALRVPEIRALLERRTARAWEDAFQEIAARSSDGAPLWEMLELMRLACSALVEAPAHFLAPLLTCRAHPRIREAARRVCAVVGVDCTPPSSLLHVRTVANGMRSIQCGIDALDGWTADVVDRLEADIRLHGDFHSLPVTSARLAAVGVTRDGVDSLLDANVLQRIDPDVAGWRRAVVHHDPDRPAGADSSLRDPRVNGRAP